VAIGRKVKNLFGPAGIRNHFRPGRSLVDTPITLPHLQLYIRD